ncbi:MAG: hypothetical protein K6E54_04515, partial [Bacteroidaceae bacterium]|nr:hypothetical protein [Bacteroidaceae bacterium]
MKVTFCLALLSLCMVANAQDTENVFRFVTADGTEIPNGTVLTVNNVKDDPFGGKELTSGIYLQNATSSETGAKITLDVNTLSSGKIQFCMLGNCQGYSESGTYTKQGVLTA